MSLDSTSEKREPSQANIKPLYRGAWIDTVKNGDKIPMGGDIFKSTLYKFVEVDTDWINEKTKELTIEKIDELWHDENEEKFGNWAKENGIKLDPRFLHTLFQVQSVTGKLLQINNSIPMTSARRDLYFSTNSAPKLSDFIGISECGERAIVGKILLDKLGIKSVLMGGVHVDEKEDDPHDHSFLILDGPQGNGSLIFDIARPKASVKDAFGNSFPRILKTEQKITYETFQGKDNFVVGAVDIYNGTKLYYGVGNGMLIQEVNFSE